MLNSPWGGLNMNRSLISATMAIGLLLLSACDGNKLQSQLVKTAPMSQEKTGFILKGANKDSLETWLAQNPEVNYRIINEAHQLYEIYNTDAETLKNQFHQAIVEKNIFVEHKNFVQFRNQLTIDSLKQDAKSLQPLAGDSIDFSTCLEDKNNEPEIYIEPATAEMATELQDLTIYEGGYFQLTSKNSKAKNSKGKLKLSWIVQAPNGSLMGRKNIGGSELTYKPDTIGTFYGAAVAQDSKNICALITFSIAVTKNVAFDVDAAKKAEGLSLNDLSPFWHLDMIQAQDAWSISQGQGVKIAVIDSGVNYNHFAISPNISTNAFEIPDNGIDDDGNGFIDDFAGYDFLNADAYPYDDSGHGTHVATTSASHLMGVAPNAKVIPIKALSGIGGDTASLVGAIYYAIDQGAHVINMSLGSYDRTPRILTDALNYAADNNIVLVAAAGNGHPVTQLGLDTDIHPNYPSNLEIPGLISVAATDDGTTLASYSNFGKISVDVVAPGGSSEREMIAGYLENIAGVEWAPMQGTSMATPVVSGIVALVKSLDFNLSHEQTIGLIMNSGTHVKNYVQVTSSGKLVNALAAAQMAARNPLK